MSRIYDALQRADLERQAAKGTDSTTDADPFVLPGAEALRPIKTGVILENITQHSWKPSMASLPTLGDRGESIEQFRGLRSQIYQFRDKAPLKTILVSSGMPSEGKTFVAANLAISLARNNNNTVLLIDADLRKPALHEILGAPNTPGLKEYLAGTAEMNDILQRNQAPRIVDADLVHNIPEFHLYPRRHGRRQLFGAHRQSPYRRTDSRPFTALRLDPDRLSAGPRVCGRNRHVPRRRCSVACCPRSNHAFRCSAARAGRLQQLAHPRLRAECSQERSTQHLLLLRLRQARGWQRIASAKG